MGAFKTETNIVSAGDKADKLVVVDSQSQKRGNMPSMRNTTGRNI